MPDNASPSKRSKSDESKTNSYKLPASSTSRHKTVTNKTPNEHLSGQYERSAQEISQESIQMIKGGNVASLSLTADSMELKGKGAGKVEHKPKLKPHMAAGLAITSQRNHLQN